jgi:hypothetical protein
MKKFSIAIFFTILTGTVFCQDENQNNKLLQLRIGAEARVTPIYFKKIPDLITTPDRNILEQPDMFLSGPAFYYSLEKFLLNCWSISFSQQIRYDMIYKSLPFNNQQPSAYFTDEDKKTVITDLYLDLFKTFEAGRSKLQGGVGIGIGGLGSKYLLTQRFLSYSNQDIYVTTQENFIYPLASATFAWSKGKFEAYLKMVYVWDNPTFYDIPFLRPQVGVSYRVF